MKNVFLFCSLLSASSLTFAAQVSSEDIENAPERVFTESTTLSSIEQIKNMAANSDCSRYSWKSRGRAPAGYTKGVALSFARSLCRLKGVSPPSPLAKIESAADTRNDRKDALTHYASTFAARNMSISVAGADTLRALYTLGLGLGMRESSGSYCEGWDTSAGSNRPSSAAEAGLFQTSYDSIGASSELSKLYSEYRANPQRCMLDVFKQGASCSSQKVLGTGAGATYQAFNKACPAFATEYAMTLLRILRTHFGPINRKEAEINLSCNSMLKNVQSLVVSDLSNVCKDIL